MLAHLKANPGATPRQAADFIRHRADAGAPEGQPVALTAPADVDVELPVDGLARDLHLELLGDVRLVERAAAVGAATGQRRLVDLIDVGGGLAMSLGAVV